MKEIFHKTYVKIYISLHFHLLSLKTHHLEKLFFMITSLAKFRKPIDQ